MSQTSVAVHGFNKKLTVKFYDFTGILILLMPFPLVFFKAMFTILIVLINVLGRFYQHKS